MSTLADRRQVPIFKLEFSQTLINDFKEGCETILRSDALAEGQYVRQFERQFASFTGAKHCIAVNSGTAALEVAFRALGVAGKTVLMPTNTFMATPIAAWRAGSRVVLLDIEDQTFSIDPSLLLRAIGERVGAVALVHIGGVISRYIDDIVHICAQHGVPIIEDAAHAHGSQRGAWHAGTIGALGCFSFFPTKVMTTGEGGMITTNDDGLAELSRSIKNFGRDLRDPLRCINDGANFKMTEFQALLGTLEMQRVALRTRKRAALAARYAEALRGTSYRIPVDQGDTSYYKQIVEIPGSREWLYSFCKERGVSLTGEVYKVPVHQQPVCSGRFTGKFPVADRFARTHICPPLYPELEVEDIDYVCQVLRLAEESGRLRSESCR